MSNSILLSRSFVIMIIIIIIILSLYIIASLDRTCLRNLFCMYTFWLKYYRVPKRWPLSNHLGLTKSLAETPSQGFFAMPRGKIQFFKDSKFSIAHWQEDLGCWALQISATINLSVNQKTCSPLQAAVIIFWMKAGIGMLTHPVSGFVLKPEALNVSFFFNLSFAFLHCYLRS